MFYQQGPGPLCCLLSTTYMCVFVCVHYIYVTAVCIVTVTCSFPCMCVASSSCVETGCLGNCPPSSTNHHDHSSQGSQQRSELRCQKGHFRDDNSPPAQTLRTFFTQSHVCICPSTPHTRLLCLTSLSSSSLCFLCFFFQRYIVRMMFELFRFPACSANISDITA